MAGEGEVIVPGSAVGPEWDKDPGKGGRKQERNSYDEYDAEWAGEEGMDETAEAAATEEEGEEGTEEETPGLTLEEEGEEEGGEQEAAAPGTKEVESLRGQVAQLTAMTKSLQDMVQFYQQQSQQGIEARRAKEPEQIPDTLPTIEELVKAGIVPPGKWDPEDWNTVQEQMGKFFDARTDQLAQYRVAKAIEQKIAPAMNRIHRAMTSVVTRLAKVMHTDFDERVKEAYDDVFTFDPQGKVVGYKNEALWNYFMAQDVPLFAAYEHAINKRAPEAAKQTGKKITDNVQKQVVSALRKRPKGPTQPTKGGRQTKLPELDWDTPPKVAGKVLDRKKL